jgi:putative N6-adenine-specific DNA methylase
VLIPQKSSLEIFAAAAPGLEAIVHRELNEMGISDATCVEGGVAFTGDVAQLYRANLCSRVASRVIVRLARFHADSFQELERRAKKIPWEDYLASGTTVKFRVTCRKSRLYHSDAVAERFAEAAVRRVPGIRVARSKESSEDVEASDESTVSSQLFIVRLTHDDCVVSVDSSGELLHRRGYRLATGKAPVRETLAAAMLIASGWDRVSPLVDPMCGSGTIPIEAALMARGIAPGVNRVFAFQRWPTYRKDIWDSFKASHSTANREDVAILASDRDDGVVKSAIANSARAGVADAIQFSAQTISNVKPPRGPGWVVTNPPYGARVGERQALRNLYSQLGKVLRQKAPGYSLSILSADRQLERMLGIPLESRFNTQNGGIPVRLMTGKVP